MAAVSLALFTAACAAESGERSTPTEALPTTSTLPIAVTPPATVPPTNPPSTPPAPTTTTTMTIPVTAPSTTAAVTTTAPPTTVPPPTTAVPAALRMRSTPPGSIHNPSCVRTVQDGETLERIADAAGIGVRELWAENGFIDAVATGHVLDVCIGNLVDDVTGGPRPAAGDPSIEHAVADNVLRQQARLNELFAPYGTQPLAVDGISGPLTGRLLCAARLALGLPTSVVDMQPGSDEQAALLTAPALPAPESPVTTAERWAVIDRTCQVMFVGSGPQTVFVFPTSTGSAGFETRDQDRARVFRYNPATETDGWHNSSEYPVGVDNPLNGNLYKPLYFDYGQAIHGANNVPPTPESKGCARLTVADQITLLTWLGLIDLTSETWLKDQINLTVSVQGAFVGRPS